MWGRQLVGEEDVWRVFHNFITDTPNEESGAKVSTKNHDYLYAENDLCIWAK